MRDRNEGTDWHAEETYKGLIQIALSALRFGVFANGGAAVALLTFLGNVKAEAAGLPLPAAKCAMALFIGGVAAGGLAHVTAYLTQLRLYGESALGDPQKGPFRHNTFLTATLVLGTVSVITFAAGAWVAAAAMRVPSAG
jgi:hypothetical protein